MKKILHITHDAVFIDTAYRVFEDAAPGRNDYVLFLNKSEPRYIKSTPVRKYHPLLIYNKRWLKRFCSSYQIFIFHSLDLVGLHILRSLPENSKVMWIGWGFDYYDLTGRELLKPLTRSVIHLDLLQRVKASIKKLLSSSVDKKSLINEIDYFSPVLYEDYLLVSRSIQDFRPRYVSWNYGTLEDDLIKGFEVLRMNGRNILLGNSTSITNNHLDALDLLSALDLNEMKIIAPLSYGNERYRSLVNARGKALFGDMFVPLVDFLPIDEYVKLISSCSVLIMNNVRQEGLGNIVIMLHLGAKVFLDSENPVHQFFKKQGAFIFTLNELSSEIGSQLSADQVALNRSILRKTWGRDVIRQKTKYLIELLDGQPPAQRRTGMNP